MTIRDHQPRQKKPSKLSDERETPQEHFEYWDGLFGFTVDAAASKQNHKLPKYWTKKTDGLKRSWRGERVWCNPPYSSISPWVQKACLFEAQTAVLLVPAWTDRKWFQGIWRHAKEHGFPTLTVGQLGKITFHFLSGRLRFGKPGSKTPDGPAPFPCMLMIFERVEK